MKQEQDGGEGSTNNQAGRDINYNGLSVEQIEALEKYLDHRVVREVAHEVSERIDVLKAEFVKFTGEANAQAMSTAGHMLAKFIEQLAISAPENIGSIKTVAMQQSILNAGTSAAIADDEDLTDTLVDILVDKSGAEPRSFKGVVLNEALAVAGKLTSDQVNFLTAQVMLRHTIVHGYSTLDEVITGLDERCRPLYDVQIPTTSTAVEYMSYAGVGEVERLGAQPLAQNIIRTYDGVLTNGFAEDQLPETLRPVFSDLPLADPRIAPDPSRRRFKVASSQTVDKLAADGSLNPLYQDHVAAMKQLMENNQCAEDRFVETLPIPLAGFLKTLDNIGAGSFLLSPVGIAIGHANWRRLDRNSAPPVDIYLR